MRTRAHTGTLVDTHTHSLSLFLSLSPTFSFTRTHLHTQLYEVVHNTTSQVLMPCLFCVSCVYMHSRLIKPPPS